MHTGRLIALVALSITGGTLLVGCGTSKLAYCTQVTNLESSVQALGKVEFSSSSVSELTAALENVSRDAKELKSALKAEFSTQTTAVKSSISTLENTAKQVSSATSTSAKAQAAVPVLGQIEALKKAFTEVQEVTKSKCK
jgi:hypothetical protein